MKNITIRRMTERGEQLYSAARDEERLLKYAMNVRQIRRGSLWMSRNVRIHAPAFERYMRYYRYRDNLKRLGIG